MIKGTIGRKITLIIFLAVSIVAVTGIVMMYFTGLNLLNNTMGAQYVQISQLLGTYVREALKSEIEDASIYTTLPLWVDIVKDANLKYKQMNTQETVVYLKDMDNKWISSQKNDPFFWGYLENRTSVAMRDIVKLRGNITEIFITDKYGGIVSASKRTSDFCQADEGWWQKAYNKGKGDIHVSDIDLDKPSDNWVISIAVPMKDKDGSVVGVCKTSLSVQRLFGELMTFKIGKTGRAVLTDNKGRVIYYNGTSSMHKQLFTEKDMNKLLSSRKRFGVFFKELLNDKKLFMAFSEINPPYLQESGVGWMIFIAQEASEISKPLGKLVIQLGIIACCLIIFTIPLGSFFGNMVARPIYELRLATERVMAGDWDHKIEAKTGDEIEQFADTFCKMIVNIKDKQKGLEILSYGLEEKVKERTKELSLAQKTTLNILKDLEKTKESLEESNKQLKQLDQLKSSFVSTVSHELRTPLSIIKESVSLILDRIPGEINEKQRRILDILKFNIDRLTRIIDSLLDISKIEAGKVELKRSLINMANIVKEITSSFEIKIKEKGLALKLDIDKETGKVYADPDRIAQVFINLISNAIKFTSSGYIEVSCKDSDNAVMCSVKDTGVGISKRDLPKIFDKFQQFGRVAGAGEKGTGLGLSIAKGIIEMHSGSISVESEPSVGSSFTFVLHKYTEQSLFSEFTAKAIKYAAQGGLKLSIIAISSKSKDGTEDAAWMKTFHDTMGECLSIIKNTLRRQGDEIVGNNGDMLVILVDCAKDHSMLVRQRLEQILNKFLEEKKVREKLDIKYGCATFPDDGRTNVELINKACSSIYQGL